MLDCMTKKYFLEPQQLSSCKDGVPLKIPNEGIINLHFQLCMIIGYTKGMMTYAVNITLNLEPFVTRFEIVTFTKQMEMTQTTHVLW